MYRHSLISLLVAASLALAARGQSPEAKIREQARAGLNLGLATNKVMAMERQAAFAGAAARMVPASHAVLNHLDEKLDKALKEKAPPPAIVWVGASPSEKIIRDMPSYVHVRLNAFAADGKGDTPRLVLLLPAKGRYYAVDSLPVDVKVADVKAAVTKLQAAGQPLVK